MRMWGYLPRAGQCSSYITTLPLLWVPNPSPVAPTRGRGRVRRILRCHFFPQPGTNPGRSPGSAEPRRQRAELPLMAPRQRCGSGMLQTAMFRPRAAAAAPAILQRRDAPAPGMLLRLLGLPRSSCPTSILAHPSLPSCWEHRMALEWCQNQKAGGFIYFDEG